MYSFLSSVFVGKEINDIKLCRKNIEGVIISEYAHNENKRKDSRRELIMLHG
jgi:hypothetical protein